MMEQEFKKLKNGFKIKLILAFSIYIIITGGLLALSIIYRKLYLYLITVGTFLLLLPILILLFNLGFNQKRDKLLVGILNEENKYGFDIELW